MSSATDIRPRRPAASGRVNQLGQAMGAKGMQTRRRLLDAAKALLETSTVRDLRVANIVRAAGTLPSTFYVYFNDVTEAVLALIGEVSQSPPNLLALLQSDWTAQQSFARAQAFVSSYIEHWQRHAALFRIRNLASDEGDERFTLLRVNAVSPLVNAMAARVLSRQRAGFAPADLHPNAVAGALLAFIERIAVIRFVQPTHGVTRDSLMDVAAFFVALVMGEGEPVDEDLGWTGPPAQFGGAEASQHPRIAQPDLNLQGQAIGRKGARTRERIIQATDQLIRTRALREIAVADITRLAKTSSSTFYLYFQDVTDVVLRLISQESQTAPRLLELLQEDCETLDAMAVSLEFVQLYVENWQKHGPLFRVRNLAADEGDERFVRARSESTRPLLLMLARRVGECQRRGVLPGALHPHSAAAAFLAMVERLAVTPNIRGPATRETINQAAAYFLSVLLCGIRRD